MATNPQILQNKIQKLIQKALYILVPLPLSPRDFTVYFCISSIANTCHRAGYMINICVLVVQIDHRWWRGDWCLDPQLDQR